MTPEPESLRWARRLSLPIVFLAAAASSAGLFVPAVYRETGWVVPQNRGQDLVTLMVLAVALPALRGAKRGSPRATLVWLGLLGYLAYTYTGAALAYHFNELFPVYVALFSLTGAALIGGLGGIDAAALSAAFDARTPRRAIAVFLLIMAAMLSALWLGQILPFYMYGRLPEMVVKAGTPTVFVFVLDLGVVVPLSLLTARWLWQRRPWGDVLAGFMLVKATTMGLALLSMTAFSLLAGIALEPTLALAWVALAGFGLVASLGFFRHAHADRS
jgi:hypothetical protein